MSTPLLAMTDPELCRIVAAIVERVDPIEVILFGSQARDESTPSSDFDLLVVMPEGTPTLPTTGVIYRALAKVAGRTRGVDVVVTDPRRLEASRGMWWSVLDAAQEEGRSIYRRGVPAGA